MSQVRIKENESLDNALRRFKRQTAKDGVIQEVRKREHYEMPSVKRRRRRKLLVKESSANICILKSGWLSTAFFFDFGVVK